MRAVASCFRTRRKTQYFNFWYSSRSLKPRGHNEQSGLLVAHSEDGKHPNQGGDNRKCDD